MKLSGSDTWRFYDWGGGGGGGGGIMKRYNYVIYSKLNSLETPLFDSTVCTFTWKVRVRLLSL